MSDVKKTMKSVTRETDAPKPSGGRGATSQVPTMNQNLQNITENLIKIYDKLDSLESRQSALEKKISAIDSTPATDLDLAEKVDAILEKQDELEASIRRVDGRVMRSVGSLNQSVTDLAEKQRSTASTVGQLDDRTADGFKSVANDTKNIRDIVDSIFNHVSLVYEAIEGGSEDDSEDDACSGNSTPIGVTPCFVDTLSRSKDEYVTALQCEMEICRTQLLKSIGELLDERRHRRSSSPRHSSEKKERVRYIGKDREF